MKKELSRVKVLSALALAGSAGASVWGDASIYQFLGIVLAAGGALSLRGRVLRRESAGLAAAISVAISDKEESETKQQIKKEKPVKAKQHGIFLGVDLETGDDFYWDVDNVPAKSCITWGLTGSGKTYAMLGIIKSIKEYYGKGGILIDLKPSFSDTDMQKEPDFLEQVNVNQNYLALEPINVNVFKAIELELGLGEDARTYREDNSKIGDRVAGVFHGVYGMSPDQFSTLSKCIEDGLDSFGGSFTLRKMLEMLEQVDGEGKDFYQHATYIKTKIRPFVNAGTGGIFNSSESGWGQMFDGGNLEVLQFAGITSEPVKEVATEIILQSILTHIMQNGSHDAVLPIYLPECHHARLTKGSPLATILGEARSKGGFVLLDTQGTAKFGKGKKDALGLISAGCNTSFYFRPVSSDIPAFAGSLHLTDDSKTQGEWASILSRLALGECVVQTAQTATIVKIRKL